MCYGGPGTVTNRGFNENVLKDVENLTPEEYFEAKLVNTAYTWRKEYDITMRNIEEKKSGFENGPGLDYDDPVSLANAKKIATERATEWTNNALPKDGGVKDTDVYVDLKHTNADSGGITFVNKKTGVAYLTLHGKNAGVKGFPRIPANLDENEVAAGRAQVQDAGKLVPINRSAAEVNALDDLSVQRSTLLMT